NVPRLIDDVRRDVSLDVLRWKDRASGERRERREHVRDGGGFGRVGDAWLRWNGGTVERWSARVVERLSGWPLGCRDRSTVRPFHRSTVHGPRREISSPVDTDVDVAVFIRDLVRMRAIEREHDAND